MKISFSDSLSGTNILVILTSRKKPELEKLPKSLKQQIILNIPKNFKPEPKKNIHLKGRYAKKSIDIYIIGTGPKNRLTANKVKKLGRTICETIKSKNSVNLTITGVFKHKEELVESIIYGSYKFTKYFTDKNKKKAKFGKITLHNTRKVNLDKVKFIAETINEVRDLVNTPPIDMTPDHLAKRVKKLKRVKVKIFDKKDLKAKKLNLILGVGAGSGNEPKLIILEYKNKPKNKKPVMFVGKGVTFDAGGLNLKPTNSIETMKMDMAGAASVYGLFKILDKFRPNVHVVGLIPAVENLVGDNAYKPGDIITSYNGKTIEIQNTDAEGRLIMADSIAYGADKYHPQCIIDVATLTGACMTALGYTRSGLVSNNRNLKRKILHASKISGDKVWPLPLDNFHRSQVKGSIADYKNYSAEIYAGAIMAGAFLEKFTKNIPWAHLDIAGTGFLDKPVAGKPAGATGAPVKLLYTFIENYFENHNRTQYAPKD